MSYFHLIILSLILTVNILIEIGKYKLVKYLNNYLFYKVQNEKAKFQQNNNS